MDEMLSFDSCYVTISLEDNIHFCCITSTNNSFLIYFGHENIVGKNIKTIIPNVIGNNHDEFVREYINTGLSNNIVFNISNLYGKHEKGHIFPIRLMVKP